MKEIQLTQGKIALVDDSDFEWLNQWKWYAAREGNTFYAQRTDRSNGKRTVKMHRLILGLSDPNILADHMDLNGLNNQRNNLREADSSKNQWNRRSVKNSSSKYLGVSFDKDKRIRKWKAIIQANNKKIVLGRFASEDEAALAYNEKALELHGEFANLNKVA